MANGPRRRHAAVLAAALAVVAGALLAPVGPSSSGPATAAPAAAGCTRDPASDLRWVSWLHRTFAGADLSLVEAVPWLDRITDGEPYATIAAAVANGGAANRRTADDLAAALLHRRATTTAELAGWAARVAAVGPDAVGVQFLASPEVWTGSGSTAAGWVDRLYRDLLRRPADAGGSAYWTGRLAAGASLEQVAAGLWWSPAAVRIRVDEVYRRVLGRPGDPTGLTYWSSQAVRVGTRAVAVTVAAGPAGWSRAQVVYGAPAAAQPPPCPPRLRWVPPPGAIVRDLRSAPIAGSRLVSLTFDDGPDPTWTPKVLSVLEKHDVLATFFLVGTSARAHPDLVRRELAAGHHVGIHSMTHPYLPGLSAAAQEREIGDSKRVVEGIAGAGSVRCFRPPYGSHNATTDRIARDHGLATILWSRDGRDWASPGVDYIVSGNLSTRYDGGRAVIILHDGGTNRSQTVAALDRLIPALKSQGYRFVQLC